MPPCTILELEPLDLDLLGVRIELGGRRDRGLDVTADPEGGLLGALLSGLLCGPDAAGVGALGDLLTGLGQVLSTLDGLDLGGDGGAGADQVQDDGDDEDGADQSSAAKPPAKRARREGGQ
jgi:hypothetical protein